MLSSSLFLIELTVLKDLKYAETHEWVKIDGDSATVGITDHAQVFLLFLSFFNRVKLNHN